MGMFAILRLGSNKQLDKGVTLVLHFFYMPTTLPRINLTVPKELNKILFQLAKRDRMSVSKKTMELIEQAIEIEEDLWFGKLAEERLKKGGRLVPHEKAWL